MSSTLHSVEEIQRHLLETLAKENEVQDASKLAPLDPQSLQAALSKLRAYQMIDFEGTSSLRWQPTQEGAELAKSGSWEARLFEMLRPDGGDTALDEVISALGEEGAKMAQMAAFRLKWVGQGSSKGTLKRLVDTMQDTTRQQLLHLDTCDESVLAGLRKRKLIEQHKQLHYRVWKGPNFALNPPTALATDLTLETIPNYHSLTFKAYNFEAMGQALPCGTLHPLLKVRHEIRQAFLQMGFSEMPTNRYVESSFWNFDALFQPQQHPSRDAHDTFFLSLPELSRKEDDQYWGDVKKVHEEGGYGSIGHRCTWDPLEARKNILRTHTTAISARMLKYLADTKQHSAKLFSIDRVFRNESLDATHLAEFHQIEGLVLDRGLNLGHLIGILETFFSRLGMRKLRFKPAFNPYTEPSMEVFAFHEGLGRWIEIGNSGIFRPEMLRPMGFPEDVSVIAWGLSLERPTMIRYGIRNIRELLGHKTDLAMLQRSPICRLEKI